MRTSNRISAVKAARKRVLGKRPSTKLRPKKRAGPKRSRR